MTPAARAGVYSRGMKRTATVIVAAAFVASPGCVVQDIHDELQGVNQRLARVELELKEIERTNDKLAALLIRLESLDLLESVDKSLHSMDGQLDTIEGSLVKLDDHLASLRRTITNIDSTIPFLRISGDQEEDAAEPGDEPAVEPTPDPDTDEQSE